MLIQCLKVTAWIAVMGALDVLYQIYVPQALIFLIYCKLAHHTEEKADNNHSKIHVSSLHCSVRKVRNILVIYWINIITANSARNAA